MKDGKSTLLEPPPSETISPAPKKTGGKRTILLSGPVASPKPSNPFPNFMQMQVRVPIIVWQVLRYISVLLALTVAILLFVQPDAGLFIFWRLFIPAVPLLFFIAPGLWRNLCPMAALNQSPRLFKFTKALTLPPWMKEYSYIIGIAMFLVIVPTRKVLFNQNGPALGLLMLVALTTAFLMGLVFKGKSGWCSSICPLLPVQRIYGQTPYITVRNSHCNPCVGCTKNCYDFNPSVAYLADLYDDDPYYTGYRRFFTAIFPGFVLAFYTIPTPPAIPVLDMYLQFGLFMLLSLGLFNFLVTFLKITTLKVTTIFAAAALNVYYWFSFPLFFDAITVNLLKLDSQAWLIWTGRGIVFALTLAWVIRTYRKEPLFIQRASGGPQVKIGSNATAAIKQTFQGNSPEIVFMPQNRRVVAKPEATLLDVAEANELHLESGCRMGMCGADPVAILEGMENLSPAGDDEQSTLERLGLAENTRMACCARVRGSVTVSLKPERAATPASAKPFVFDPGVKRVVIIGNGIAGMTAADHVRRRHPECEISVIGREEHPLYNRMGISRLIYGRSAMQGLFLLPETWPEERKVNCWLNTQAIQVDREGQKVLLGTGETLEYDRLILAMGSSSTLPPVTGADRPGVFVLREAVDAIQMRAYAQRVKATRAVIAGGGLLGLEAAYALLKLGLQVTVLERGRWLLRRQLDERGGQLLAEYLQGLGLNILREVELAGVSGNEQAEQITLSDGQNLPCDLLVISVGITPNTELAKEAGLPVARGVLVDEHMRTSDPRVYAVGDVAEYRKQVQGLWPVAVEQAEVAATNVVCPENSEDVRKYSGTISATALKVVGVELASIGQFEANDPQDEVIALENSQEHRYRKLVIRDGKIIGALLLGYPLYVSALTNAIKKQIDITQHLVELRAGNWEVLK